MCENIFEYTNGMRQNLPIKESELQEIIRQERQGMKRTEEEI